MSRFYVGQRVRLVRCREALEKIGRHVPGSPGETGTLLEFSTLDGEWLVDWDLDEPAWVLPSQIEPIRDDEQTGSWEQVHAICGFKPQGVSA